MKISEIIYREEYIFSNADEDLEIDRITTSFNDADEKALLIIPNSKNIPEVITSIKYPAAVICDNEAKIPKEIPVIRVENPRLALSNACFRFEGIDISKFKLIGVTGTNGKTTTATFIKKILERCGYKVGFIGTGKIEIGNESITNSDYSMTTPDPTVLYKVLKRMEIEKCEAVVMEVSSHSLALDKVAPLKFDYGVFTNLSREHTDFHSDMEDYFHTKCRLFSQCKKAIFNVDDEYGRRAYNECSQEKLSVGVIWSADVEGRNIENQGLDGVSYIYRCDDFSCKIKLKAAGVYNVYNSMLAAAVCIDIGCKPCEVRPALYEISSIPGRFEIINDEITVIIDYAHTDFAFYNIMKELYSLKRGNSLAVVFGCGGERDKTKRPKMAEIAESFADRIIVTQDNSRNEDPKDIISDIIRGFKMKSYTVNENREKAIEYAILSAKKGDIVAIIGKGAEKYNIDKDGYHDFDEKAIINSALKKRKVIF